MSSSHSESRIALVTGGSRGIGAAITERLASDGFAVAVNYVSNAAATDALVTALRNRGHRVMPVQGNVADPGDVRTMFDLVEQSLGAVDVLVNNAGVLQTAPLAEASDALFDQTFAVNVKGTFNTLREAARRMKEGGRIINFSSTAPVLGMPGYGVYNASKAAVEAMTKVFAKELRGRQIMVNAVAPGPIATDLFLSGKTPEQIAGFAKMSPLERLGHPDDIARLVAFLAGPDACWINGQCVLANGGLA